MNVQYGNGWALVVKALDIGSNAPGFADDAPADPSEGRKFCDNPAQYVWTYIDKKEMLVPYDCTPLPSLSAGESQRLKFPNAVNTHWELRRVLVVEGQLQKGESNILARRRFYIEEDSWLILLGEGFDQSGLMVKCFMLYKCAAQLNHMGGRWYPMCDPES